MDNLFLTALSLFEIDSSAATKHPVSLHIPFTIESVTANLIVDSRVRGIGNFR